MRRTACATGRSQGRGMAAFAGFLAALVLGILGAAAPASAQGLRFIRDAEIEDLLNDYARPIFRAAGLGAQRIRVRIVNDRSFNAFVLDGRNVFINSGALMDALVPNEVIGVLAHETGHIAGGHMAALRTKIEQDSSRALLMQILGIGAMVAGSLDKSGDGATAGVGKSILSATPEMTMRSILSYRRVQEYSADQAGVKFLDATHQSAQGMLTTFERFASEELFSERMKSAYVASHPMARDRIDQLRRLAEASPYYTVLDPPELQARHDLMRAKLMAYCLPPASVRTAFPPGSGLPALYAQVISRNCSSDCSGRCSLAGPDSLAEIDALIGEDPENPYFYELKGNILLGSGQPQEAVKALRFAQKHSRSALISVELAEALVRSDSDQSMDEAIKLLRKALIEEDNSDGYQQLATAYYRRGDQGEANLAAAQAALLQGRLKEAKAFAKRAQSFLSEGTPSWIKADDIISIQEPSSE